MNGRFTVKFDELSRDCSEFRPPAGEQILVRTKLKACVHSGRKTSIRFS